MDLGNVTGSQYASAPKGKRILADIFDLLIIPIIIGVVAGLLLMTAPDVFRGIIMVALNVAWLVFRDAIYAPGRAIAGIRIVSLTSSRVSVMQAIQRNLLLMVPIVLLIGYPAEIISVLARGERLLDKWAGTKVIA